MKIFICLMLVLYPFILPAETEEWVLAKEKDAVSVYTRAIKGSDYKEFKGETVINTSLSSLVALLEDVDACKDWLYKCERMVRIAEGYVFRLNDLPWPVTDRYFITHSNYEFDEENKNYTVWFKGVKKDDLPKEVKYDLPPTEGYIQMEKSNGFWKFIPQNTGEMKVIYQMHGEPGGSIPSSIANTGVVNAPLETLLKMRELVKQQKYQEKK